MATTKIWSIKGRLDHVLSYAGDEDKTRNPGYTEADLQGLRDVMDYTCQDYKTEKQHYVSGINCDPETARQDMTLTKKQYGKMGGIIAFHAYQSFAPGEITPDMAHEVGVKLAREMWGGRFEVLVATHLDKSHVHNHFVLNSVSFKDGLKFNNCKQTHPEMAKFSDELCRQYGLSVIHRTEDRNQSRHYAEWQAEQQGQPTYRSLVRADIDKAIKQSLTDRQFFQNLKKMGYEIKIGKDITVRPEGKDRGLKLYRNFGEDYTMSAINRRILSQGMAQKPFHRPQPPAPPQRIKVHGNIRTAGRIRGFRALYIRYIYLLGGFDKYRREPSSKQIRFMFREDVRKLHTIAGELKLLSVNRIDSGERLLSYKAGVTAKMTELEDTRKHLRYRARSVKDETAVTQIKEEISDLSKQIGELRKEVKLCNGIETRTAAMKKKIRMAEQWRMEKGELIMNRVPEPQSRKPILR